MNNNPAYEKFPSGVIVYPKNIKNTVQAHEAATAVVDAIYSRVKELGNGSA